MAVNPQADISIADISKLFQDCVQCFQEIKYGQELGDGYEIALLTLDASLMRLTRWAESVGLEKAGPAHNEFTVNMLLLSKSVLGQIVVAFEHARESSEKYEGDMKLMDNTSVLETIDEDKKLSDETAKVHAGMRRIINSRQKTTSFTQRARLALYDQSRINELVQKVASLTDTLIQAFPKAQTEQKKLAQEEVKNIAHSAKEANVIQQAAKIADKVLEEAAIEVERQMKGSEFYDVRISNSDAHLGHDVAHGVRVPGSIYRGLVIDGGSSAMVGNIYRGPNAPQTSIFGPIAASRALQGRRVAPPSQWRNANAPNEYEVEEFDDDIDVADTYMRHPLFLDRKRTNTANSSSTRRDTGFR